MKSRTRITHCAALTALAVLASSPLHAALVDLEALQLGQASLEFQYTFEGGDDSSRLADGSGNGWTLQRLNGADGGDVNSIGFLTGYDGSSQAYSPSFDAGGYRIGAGLNTVATNVPIGQQVTIEAVVQFNAFTLPTGGSGAYIVSARAQPNNQRGYFFRQLESGSGDGRLATTLGDTFGDQLDVLEPYTAGDWYYVALVADVTSGTSDVTVYGANLSQGETVLSMLADDSTLFTGDWSGEGQVGIGNFLNGTQEYLNGAIDNTALYNSLLSQSTLQSHLTALIPEPSVTLLGGLGLLGLLRRRRS